MINHVYNNVIDSFSDNISKNVKLWKKSLDLKSEKDVHKNDAKDATRNVLAVAYRQKDFT